MVYCISNNTPLGQSDPLPITKILPKVVATNSHNIHQGNGMNKLISGKVGVSDLDNNVESLVLENGEIIGYVHEYINYKATPKTINKGDLLKFTGYPSPDGVFEHVMDTAYDFTPADNINIDDYTRFKRLTTSTIQTPKHSTITLNSTDVSASKYFVAQCEYYNGEIGICAFGEEMISNAGVYDGDNLQFDNLTNGTFVDLNGVTCNSRVASKRLGVYND
jgi:hypothetical protein